MGDNLDHRHHPEVNVKRRLFGMDYKAGAAVLMGALLFVIITGAGVSSGNLILGFVGGVAAMGCCYCFARKFLNNRPSSYFSDWIESRRLPNYVPHKFSKSKITETK